MGSIIRLVVIVVGFTLIGNSGFGQITRIGEHTIPSHDDHFYIQEVSPNEFLAITYGVEFLSRHLKISYLDSTLYKKVVYPIYNNDSFPIINIVSEHLGSWLTANKIPPKPFPLTRTVFNNDSLIEFIVWYSHPKPQLGGDFLILNENGQILDSLPNRSHLVFLFDGPGYSILANDSTPWIPSHWRRTLFKLNGRITTNPLRIDIEPESIVWPNPFSQEVRISLKDIRLYTDSYATITDMHGKELSRFTDIIGEDELHWTAHNISSGNYIFSIYNNGKRISKKIVYIGE